MKWLIWSSQNLNKSVGGVELHAQCLARELKALGDEVIFSTDHNDLENLDYDILQTHGSIVDFKMLSKRKKTAIWFHTLHGWSWERMKACGEYLWLGGYKAYFLEKICAQNADHVFLVHKNIKGKFKSSSVIGNGWDAGAAESGDAAACKNSVDDLGKLTDEAIAKKISDLHVHDEWLFIGRGADVVKGAGRLEKVIEKYQGKIKLSAIPGDGFQSKNIKKLGVMDSKSIREVMKRSQGVLVPSYYEGLPLVALEALSLGVPLLVTPVGGLKTLEGFHNFDFFNPEDADFLDKTKKVENFDREEAATFNKKKLKTWKQIAVEQREKYKEIKNVL